MNLFKEYSSGLRKTLMLAALLAVFGCSSDPLGPSALIQVDKAVDTFLLTAMTLEDGTDIISHRWDNTGTQASIDIADGISSGSAILTVWDDAGTIVHQEDIADDNDTDTSVGVAGSWQIEIDIQNVTGSFTLSIVKRD